MSKKIKSILISVGILLILFTGIILANGESLFSEYGKHIKLGYKYLDQGKYDEAILTFNKAIEIDAKTDKSYIGLAKVYITRFDKNAIDDAHNTLNLGYEQSKSDNIINSYMENANQLYDNGKTDEAIELLEKELEALKLQKKGLMQILLTGEVRVKIDN